jgi:hypothetical protein
VHALPGAVQHGPLVMHCLHIFECHLAGVPLRVGVVCAADFELQRGPARNPLQLQGIMLHAAAEVLLPNFIIFVMRGSSITMPGLP